MFIFVTMKKEANILQSMKFLMENLVKLKNLLIEEFLKGEEMSYFIISDGYNIFKILGPHKITKEF